MVLRQMILMEVEELIQHVVVRDGLFWQALMPLTIRGGSIHFPPPKLISEIIPFGGRQKGEAIMKVLPCLAS